MITAVTQLSRFYILNASTKTPQQVNSEEVKAFSKEMTETPPQEEDPLPV